MIEFRSVVASNGYFTPQYKKEGGEWKDFKVKNIKQYSALEEIAISLGKPAKWAGNIWHYSPGKGEKVEDMSLAFRGLLKCSAFLGACYAFYDEPPVINFKPKKLCQT